MPRACSICTHRQRAEIEIALASGASFRNVAGRYGTSATALHRHRKHVCQAEHRTKLQGENGAAGNETLTAAGRQGRPPGRREKAFPLSHQDRQMLDLLGTGQAQTIAQAAKMVGLSKNSGYAIVDSLAGRAILQAAFRHQGLTEQQLAGKIIRLLDAQMTKFFQKDGVVMDERTVSDNQTQLGAARLAAELMDLKPQEVNSAPDKVGPIVAIEFVSRQAPAEGGSEQRVTAVLDFGARPMGRGAPEGVDRG